MFREMRRSERQLTQIQMEKILHSQTDGVLSVYGENGFPYGVPVNYAYVDQKFYIHATSKNSHKLEALRTNNHVCMTIVSQHDLMIEQYTEHYASVIAFGYANILETHEQKKEAMKKMMQVLAPEKINDAMKMCETSTDDFVMIEIIPVHMSGKANK